MDDDESKTPNGIILMSCKYSRHTFVRKALLSESAWLLLYLTIIVMSEKARFILFAEVPLNYFTPPPVYGRRVSDRVSKP